MRKDEKFMSLAMDKASFSHCVARYRMGSVIVQNNRDIVSSAHNIYQINDKSPTIHSEVAAVIRANKSRLPGSTIYVSGYRINRITGVRNTICTRPCNKCQLFLRMFDIKWMVYLDKTGNIQQELL